LVFVAFTTAGAMHDDLRALHRRFNPLIVGQVTGHELDALRAHALSAAEHAYVAPRIPQPRHDETAQSACAAGDQDG
jgi:hypothetical protein